MIGKGSYTGTKTLDICVTSDQNILANNYDSGWEPEPEPGTKQPSHSGRESDSDSGRYCVRRTMQCRQTMITILGIL